MVNHRDELGMLPASKKFESSGTRRPWLSASLFISGTFVLTSLALDQIVGKEHVIAKFSPTATHRKADTEAAEQPTQLASLSVTASSVTPSVASMPATVVAVSSTPSAVAAMPARDLVTPAFEDWVRLWQARDVNGYIALYSSERPELQGHLQVRSSRIREAEFIEVSVSDVSFRESAPSETTVRFVQAYRSDSHQSRDIKELVWRIEGKKAKIIAERLVN